MILRCGFVSNSSSSSFVLAVKKGKPIVATVEVDLMQYAKHTFKSEKDVVDWLHANYMYRTIEGAKADSPELKRTIEGIQSALAKGDTVVSVEVGSEDGDPLSSLLYRTGLKDFLSDDVRSLE